MRIRELIDRTGVAERQVRYLVAEGFIPGPSGGRAQAEYGQVHVDGIRRYMRLRELGFPPAAIRLLLEARDGTPFPIVPGLTLLVSPDLIASGTPPAPLLADIETLLTRLLAGHAEREEDDARDD